MKALLAIFLILPMVANADRFEHHHHRHNLLIPLGILTGAMIYNQYHEQEYREQLEYQEQIEHRERSEYQERSNRCQYFLDTRQYSEYDYYCR